MTTRLYYTAPSDECFEDLKQKSIELWKSKHAHPSYEKEKVDYIEKMQNISDNFMTLFAMFDHNNQRKVGETISQATKDALNERLIDGGSEYAIL